MKTCTKCGEEKEFDQFYKLNNKNGKSYCSSMCKPCSSKNSKKYYHSTRKINENRTKRVGHPNFEEAYPDKLDKLKEMLKENPRVSLLKLSKECETTSNTIKKLFTRGILTV